MMAIGLVIALHIALIYALMSGLARDVVKSISAPIEVEIIEAPETVEQEPPPPPPPAPEIAPPPAAFVPMPELTINLPEPPKPPEKTITQVQSKVETTPPPAPQQKRDLTPPPEPAPEPAPPPKPAGTPVRMDPSRPATQPDYPNAARRREMEGTVVLNLLIGPNGRVQDAKILQSSGHDLLDRAALRHAQREWRFLPATEGGEPVTKWFRFAVEFKLEG